ncbi:hypothetical protein [Beijerinckia sp. L45]|uniref:hypothetical protein n=1 Tax=Beijerinckia sp. L45 TaxID=1641855 RepID=UPI00131B79A7|nr:hypothetical protein [Beijerinckia sp. L45]
MRQATSGRTNLFSPFLQAIAARAAQAAAIGRPAQDAIYAVSHERQGTAIITTRGQRFSIHQIGSMFGSE